MNEWLDEEVAELDQAKKDKAAEKKKLKLRQQQTQVLWKNLKHVLRDAVQQINATPKLRKLTGGLSCGRDYGNKVKIKKTASPAIVLSMTCEPTSLSLHYVLLTNIKAKSGQPSFHTLYVSLDEHGQPCFQFLREDKSFNVEQAARHILRPFLHPEEL